MGVKLGRVAGGGLSWCFPRHLDVAPKGQKTEPVIGVTAAKAEKALAEAHGKDFDAYSTQLGDGEMAELVHQYHDAEHNKHGNCAG
jgi:hypothetical protein